MRRREFIAFVGGLSLAWPSAARAERMRQIGLLMGYAETDADTQANLAALREALQELDWAEGRNIRINYFLSRIVRCHPRLRVTVVLYDVRPLQADSSALRWL